MNNFERIELLKLFKAADFPKLLQENNVISWKLYFKKRGGPLSDFDFILLIESNGKLYLFHLVQIQTEIQNLLIKLEEKNPKLLINFRLETINGFRQFLARRDFSKELQESIIAEFDILDNLLNKLEQGLTIFKAYHQSGFFRQWQALEAKRESSEPLVSSLVSFHFTSAG